MFGLLSSIFACGFSIVLPVLASYKALVANDLALIRPWLMYWVVLGLGLTVEATLQPLLNLLPLYGMVRFLTLFWLVLPQTQGAVYLYTSYLEPWLVENGDALDTFAINSCVSARNFTVRWLNSLCGTSIAEMQPPNPNDSGADHTVTSLAQALYSGFRLPVTTDNLSAWISGWKASPKATKEYIENYNKLLNHAASLEKLRDESLDSDGYDVIDPQSVATGTSTPEKTERARKRWW